jgi:hypothetical protein
MANFTKMIATFLLLKYGELITLLGMVQVLLRTEYEEHPQLIYSQQHINLQYVCYKKSKTLMRAQGEAGLLRGHLQ